MYRQFYKGSVVMEVLDLADIDYLLTTELSVRQAGIIGSIRGRLQQRQAYIDSTVQSFSNRIDAIELEICSVKRLIAKKESYSILSRSASLPNLHLC
jgi:hypothetical protein